MDFAFVVKRFFEDLVNIICPLVCLGCGRRLSSDTEKYICNSCLNKIQKVDYYRYDGNTVTDKFFVESIDVVYGSCFLKFDKGEETQMMIHNIKYRNNPELGVKLGRMAAKAFVKYERYKDVDYILPVPMHPKKQRKRGFNQAERIAAGISMVIDKPVREDLLMKVVNSQSQTKMNRAERRANSERIFEAVAIEEVSDKHFLIVDDVFTTGSTLIVCARKLKEAMPNCKISIFALAKA